MTMRKYKPLTLSLAIVPLLLSGTYWATSTNNTNSADYEPTAELLPVATFTATAVNSYERLRSYTGELRELRRSSLGFQRSGEVVELSIEEGDAVTSGQVLARIDDRHLRARRAQIEAQVAEAAAILEELTAGPRKETIAAKRAELEAQQARRDSLALQVERREKLVGTSTVSREEYESTLYEHRAAQAICQQIERQLDEYLAGTRSEQISAQRARLAHLDAQLTEIAHDLEDTLLKAPFSGRISQRLVDVGTVVTAGTAVFELLDDTSLEAWIGVPPSATEGMVPGETRTMEVGGQVFTAQLRALGPNVDQATRTRKVILQIDPDEGAALLPGQTVRMSVVEKVSERGYWVPTSSLTRGRRGLWSVFVVESDGGEGVVAQREIELLDTVGEKSFVRGTLQSGDEVVAGGTHRVVVGQQVVAQPTLLTFLSP
jgi:multidrug efflux pump subunit AcrA (membrane-fusion protein)